MIKLVVPETRAPGSPDQKLQEQLLASDAFLDAIAARVAGKMQAAQPGDYLTVAEAAAALRLHPGYVRQLIASGKLQAFKTGPGKQSRVLIPRGEIDRLVGRP